MNTKSAVAGWLKLAALILTVVGSGQVEGIPDGLSETIDVVAVGLAAGSAKLAKQLRGQADEDVVASK